MTRSNLAQYLAVMLILVLTACGGSAEASTSTPEPVATPTATPAPSLAEVMRQVRQATIHIMTDASYTGIDGAPYLGDGSGSGFIIDESGIAVTNNHVVTGARSFKVYVGGESEPLSAKVLGVSECSDLAVIDLEGDGYPVMEWYTEPLYAGLDVYAAGHPQGNPEFTLTRGIVSTESANGETSWASVEGVIQHDATINPGNSGGPLVTQEGKVVAVNYANRDEDRQGVSISYFAISGVEAQEIIEQLREGQDVLSVGLNGEAIKSKDGKSSGIWVKSVQSGSPADRALIKGGDIITQLEGKDLAVDGTMQEYCDTLRSHDLDDTLNIQVVRLATNEILEGQLNGRELAVVASIKDPTPTPAPTAAPDDHAQVTDDSKAILAEIPAAWQDIDGSVLKDGQGNITGVSINAAGDIKKFLHTDPKFSVPGVRLVVSRDNTQPAQFLKDFGTPAYLQGCAAPQRHDYNSSPYTGYYDVYSGCGPGQSQFFVMAFRVKANNQNHFVFILARDMKPADIDHLLETLIIGNLP